MNTKHLVIITIPCRDLMEMLRGDTAVVTPTKTTKTYKATKSNTSNRNRRPLQQGRVPFIRHWKSMCIFSD